MIHSCFAILLCMSLLVPRAAQTQANAESYPSVSILLPSNIPSETVQISYFMIGPFGGYVSYAESRPDLHSYEIFALVEGKAATEIRIVVYAAGCEIQKFVIPLTEASRVETEFSCQPVATVRLSGQIRPNELVRENAAELVVMYMAYWAFEVADGGPPRFYLATVNVGASGNFQIDLPYFSVDAAAPSTLEPSGEFCLGLRDAKTGNPIVVKPQPDVPELRLADGCLQIRSHYPDDLKFTGEPIKPAKQAIQ